MTALAAVRETVESFVTAGERPVVGQIGYTPRAKLVLAYAEEEARRLNHDYIGTEHILLGIIREGEGIAAAAIEHAE